MGFGGAALQSEVAPRLISRGFGRPKLTESTATRATSSRRLPSRQTSTTGMPVRPSIGRLVQSPNRRQAQVWCARFGQEVVRAGAIILDDAHVALGFVREAFTLKVTVKDHRRSIRNWPVGFGRRSRTSGAAAPSRASFAARTSASWRCRAGLGTARSATSRNISGVSKRPIRLFWPFLRDTLDVCHCLFQSLGGGHHAATRACRPFANRRASSEAYDDDGASPLQERISKVLSPAASSGRGFQ